MMVYGLPPLDVKERLGMKDHEALRISNAIYGLLNAPKQWYESLCGVLVTSGFKRKHHWLFGRSCG